MNHHITTDPACRKHRTPRNALARWWFDRNRGRSCRLCAGNELHQYDPDTYTCICGAPDHPEWGVTA